MTRIPNGSSLATGGAFPPFVVGGQALHQLGQDLTELPAWRGRSAAWFECASSDNFYAAVQPPRVRPLSALALASGVSPDLLSRTRSVPLRGSTGGDLATYLAGLRQFAETAEMRVETIGQGGRALRFPKADLGSLRHLVESLKRYVSGAQEAIARLSGSPNASKILDEARLNLTRGLSLAEAMRGEFESAVQGGFFGARSDVGKDLQRFLAVMRSRFPGIFAAGAVMLVGGALLAVSRSEAA